MTEPRQRKSKSKNAPAPTPPAEATEAADTTVSPNRQPLTPGITKQRLWSRVVMVLAVTVVVYFNSKAKKEVAIATQAEYTNFKSQEVRCSDDYTKELSKFPGCVPQKCGRLISDGIATETETKTLLELAKRGFAISTSDGGASILDLHSGALSKGDKFVNFYKLDESKDIVRPEDMKVYKSVKNKIHFAISEHFGIEMKRLHLTFPTFFSRMTKRPPKTIHDEYWHPHVDKETYGSFHYTSLLYLNDFGKDFQGGRFIFVDADNTNRTVEPRRGRVSMFTSGSENIHFVEKVEAGKRYALTVSFTCDPTKAVSENVGQKSVDPSTHSNV